MVRPDIPRQKTKIGLCILEPQNIPCFDRNEFTGRRQALFDAMQVCHFLDGPLSPEKFMAYLRERGLYEKGDGTILAQCIDAFVIPPPPKVCE